MSEIQTVDLMCNMQRNPLGVDENIPQFSWRMDSLEQGQCQTGYQIIVYTSENDMRNVYWNSGWVKSSECIEIFYVGKPLLPRTRYFWKVRQKDKNGLVGTWSMEAFFETGLMGKYLGQWIGTPESLLPRSKPDPQPAPMLRKSFSLPGKIKSGRVYICGLGYHVLYINGKRVGNGLLAPGVSQYDKTVYYETHDVTDYLISGDNVIGVVLGNGLYNSYTEEPWNFKQAPWRSKPKLWLEAHFEMMDGQELSISSDGSWKAALGPVVADGLRHGECYDARKERIGWSTPKYDDTEFVPIQIKRTPGGLLKSQQCIPICRVDTLQAIEIKEVKPGVWVYDFGKNITGFIRIDTKGYRGSEIVFRYSERVDVDGNINQEKIAAYIYSGEFQTDRYIMKGAEKESWTPEFTYHGFRYVEITGYPGNHTKEAFQADVVYTNQTVRGEFCCSNPLINKIQKATVQSILTNFHGFPTDCPHREKNGWLCDAWLAAEAALLNLDPKTVYRKWIGDIVDAQRPDGHLPGIVPTAAWGYNRTGPAWGIAIIMIPYYQYIYTGDKKILSKNYLAMQKFFENMQRMENEGIIAVDGEEHWAFGDWMPPGGNSARKCPVALTDTATYFLAAKILSVIADALEYMADAENYRRKAQYIRKCFRREFLSENGALWERQCQTAIAAVLFHEFCEPEEKNVLIQNLVKEIRKSNTHVDVGFLGMKYLIRTLVQHELVDLGYEMFIKEDYPGFGFMIDNGGTTLWEDWEGNLSQNHPSYSDISTFLYQGLAGICVDANHPGFRKFFLRPVAPEGLEWVEAWHDSPYGRIESRWHRKDGCIEYQCTVPPNTEATVRLFDGKVIMLNAGKYKFVVKEGKKHNDFGQI
ncbi:MAG: family 78 glycoside hydrolase catalytic domain [Lachnospiraceae bacterium]|nr:family 78 glycoside hydrolase catalytic domain [Lachnospiraceae bacterium]